MKEGEFINPEAEKAEPAVPNMLKDFDACVEAVIVIEAEMAGLEQMNDKDKRIIREQMPNALATLQERINNMSSDEIKISRRAKTGFQGLGEWNRYGVRADGSILLSGQHSIDKCIAKAKELGIEAPRII